MKNGKRTALAASLLCCALLSACAPQTANLPGSPGEDDVFSITKAPLPDINDQSFAEDTSIYDADAPGSLVTFYVTVRRGREADRTNHSFKEVNSVLHLQETANVEH